MSMSKDPVKGILDMHEASRPEYIAAKRLQFVRYLKEHGHARLEQAIYDDEDQSGVYEKRINGVIPRAPYFVARDLQESTRKRTHFGFRKVWALHPICDDLTPEQIVEIGKDDVKAWEDLRWSVLEEEMDA